LLDESPPGDPADIQPRRYTVDEPHSEGFEYAMSYPLVRAIFHRRSRRICKGIQQVNAGEHSYQSREKPQPLTPLEEAMLIAVVGVTGMNLPDRPFQDNGQPPQPILGTPNLSFTGRAAGSTDNSQPTSFFLINDSGTYFLRRLKPEEVKPEAPPTPEEMIRRAELAKVRVRDERLDFPRNFPYYLDSNRLLSNIEGSTILLPIVDMTRQYINALMYVLTEPAGYRPALVDDRNFYLPAGVRKWIRSGFLNKDLKISLGALGTMRTQIEAELLLQNLMLTLQVMGLGGWIHAAIGPPYLLGHPYFAKETKGLAFRHVIPRAFFPLELLRWGSVLPILRANPVGLDGVIETMCPPYYKDMSAAVDAVIAEKRALYGDRAFFGKAFKTRGDLFCGEVPFYEPEVIECTKDICNYIYNTHGRFPAHVDAIYVPGIWIQAHHLDLAYYDQLFQDGYTETQARHQERWHGNGQVPPAGAT
jgi:hypothetical protein